MSNQIIKGKALFIYAASILIGGLVFVIAGCIRVSPDEAPTQQIPHSTITITVASPKPSVTPSVEHTVIPLITPTPYFTPTPQLYLRNVHLANEPFPANVERLSWSSESTTLYYLLPEGLFEFSIKNDQSTPSNLIRLPIPTPEIFSRIPQAARNISVSPSGEKMLFTMPIPGMKTPTYPSLSETEQGGEWGIVEDEELWLLDNMELVKISQIEGCVDRYFWSDDETKVVIQSATPPIVCNATVWVLEVEERAISTLWTQDRYPDSIYIYSISPDGTQIQYDRHFIPFLYNIDTSTFVELPYPSFRYSHWLDDEQMIVVYPDDDLQSYVISKINVSDLSEEKLLISRDYPELKNQRINEISLSPDKRFIAFTTGSDHYLSGTIWILKIDTGDYLVHPG